MRGPAGRPLVAMALLALAVIGCDATPRPSGSAATGRATAGPSSAAAGPADCAARIAATKLADASTIRAVDACRFTLGGRSAAQAALAGGATGGALWAAVWVYAASGNDPAPLLPILQSTDASARAMAAAALVGFGQASGFEALRQALADDTSLAAAEPPMSIATFVAATLATSIVADVQPVDAAGWDAWLRSNSARLRFDATSGTWSLP